VRPFVLADVRCPLRGGGEACLGRLRLDESWAAHEDAEEIVEGLLACERCSAHFPILCGLPVLLPDPWRSLAGRRSQLVETAREHGLPIGRAMLELLRERAGAECGGEAPGDKYETRTTLHEYLGAHYDDWREALPVGHPVRELLEVCYRPDFYARALALLAPHLDGRGVAVDVGCNVGRSVWELAGACERVYGIETSFVAALTARRILRGFPDAPTSYELRLDGTRTRQRPLPSRRRANAEVLVASAEALPFASASLSVSNSWNVLDRLPDPARALAEQARVTAPGGVFSLASPYNWECACTPPDRWLGGRGGVATIDAVRALVAGRMEILAEQEHLPWVFWLNERCFELFSSHGLVARNHGSR
jgi:SAM-dependent methyltransferase/uncharacterized protein YbaR (Trm112 family)